MKKSLFILLSILTCMWLLISCNTSGCVNNQNSMPLAGFYSSETGASASLNSINIHGIGAPGDSLILAAGSPATQVYLPMRSAYESVSWCLSYAEPDLDIPELNDTISFDYFSEPFFASEECGAMYCYRIWRMNHTTHLIDSVIIADSLITNVDLERIKIYFRTQESEPMPDQPEVAE